ncbi:MAG: zf-TFIIB domain-containing protein [Longimicrobiales bacterium]
MTQLQVRYPCPVCLGVKMEKAELPGGLTLDHCTRCGGVWFEMGEVQQLRKTEPAELWRRIAQREGVHSMQCHSCSTHLARTESHCPSCGWKVELDCPVCAKKMDVAEQGNLRLDFCTTCKGVWFDHDELTMIWNLEVTALMQRQSGSGGVGAAEGVLGALMYDPFAMYYGMHAAGYVVGSAAEMLANAPELIAAAPEVAGSLFETIVEIIASLFE